GNAALEEIIMALRTRRAFFGGIETGVNAKEIVRTSRLVSRMSSFVVQRNKAVVGENAFAHGAGIHQDGILKHRETYEIMDPREIGWGETELPLTKHSGRAALAQRLEHLGFQLSPAELDAVFARFKQVGDRKKFVYDDDLAALVEDGPLAASELFALDYLHVTSGTTTVPTATVRLARRNGEAPEGAPQPAHWQDSAPGNGAVDAAMKAIDRILGKRGELVEYQVSAVTAGEDALGEVMLKVDFGDGRVVTGKGASTDVVEASARAYLNAVGRVVGPQPRAAAAV
ncbi:MAG: 2-isopropylmalate synthase, partial [Verrucomicrobia bacterium]|nr:2-isopropylmalate synthase [Verrucomicrobiota bacterium]